MPNELPPEDTHAPSPPDARAPAASSEHVPVPDEEHDEDNKSNRPLIALAFLLVLAIGGWLLISKLMDANSVQDCVMSGRRNCAPIDTATR